MARVQTKVVLALAVLAAWACAKANDSELGGGAYDPNAKAGSGGTSAKGGAGGSSATAGTSTGGSSGKGGSAASGGASATGGTSATGGAGGSTGGTGGSTTDGGAAGDPGVPPDVLANASVILYYQAKNATEMTGTVDMRLLLENKSKDALDLSRVVVRYWMTAEPSAVNTHTYYHAPTILENAPTFVDDGANSHVEFTFSGDTIPGHNSDLNATEFQATLDAANNQKFDQSDDWSFNGAFTGNPQPNDKITVYLAGKLIWGCEPSGKCPTTSGAGGAGGEGGQAGQAGQAGGGGTSAGQSGDAGMGGQAGT